MGESRPESLVAFMPLVLDKLLLLIVKPPTVAGKLLSRLYTGLPTRMRIQIPNVWNLLCVSLHSGLLVGQNWLVLINLVNHQNT